MTLPFEFSVQGTPLSYQTKNRDRLQRWVATVRAEAVRRWPQGQPAVTTQLLMTVVYFHEGVAIRLDNDNMVKPIQDALNGLVYQDDRQITDTRIRKSRLDAQFRVRNMSPVIAEGFVHRSEFLYIRIEEAPSHAELL